MKNFGTIVTCAIIAMSVFLLGFNYKKTTEPNAFYKVYLDDEEIGVVKSKKSLEQYIDKEGSRWKKEYDVDNVYAPEGLEIKKITTYDGKLDTVQDVYSKIKEKRPFTIKGYQVTIRQEVASAEKEDETETKISRYYVIKESVFSEAAEKAIETMVGKDKYAAYLNETQEAITTTGSQITDVYIDGDKTIKEMKIPVTERIFKTVDELSSHLLYGDDTQKNYEYTVQLDDSVEKVAFNHKISTGEFLILNQDIKSENALLYPGQKVIIGVLNPQISIVTNMYTVVDRESNYGQEIIDDDELTLGDEIIDVKGKKGKERIYQQVKYVNGEMNYVKVLQTETLEAPVNEVIRRGTHNVPNVGSLISWGWPTDPGWTITSGYVWRINPINGQRELHDAIDIAGTGYGSPIYAANNGTIVETRYTYINGNYVVINHNNGYYTYYGHMSRFGKFKEGQTVSRGSIIGYVGDTGWATGPHVHFGIWKGRPYWPGSVSYNPMNFY